MVAEQRIFNYRSLAKKAAYELYGKEIADKVRAAKTDAEIESIMRKARKSMD